MPRASFPIRFECANCRRDTTVEHSDTEQLHTNPCSINAVEIVLQRRGWIRDDIKGLIFCPACAEAKT